MGPVTSRYSEYRPPASLRGWVECGWSAGSPDAGVRDVLPDGCMDLVWTGAELLVAGPDTVPHPYRSPPGGPPASGLRFVPGGLPALLGIPAAALLDQRVPLIELRPGPARDAIARLEHSAPPAAVLLDLAARLAAGGTAEPGSHAVVDLVGRGRSAGEIAGALGWTTRSLHRHCLGWFGYGPSVLRRILRFRAASALLHEGVPPAAVAARTGYADQPHLSREVRALAGRSPGQLASGA